MADEFNDIQFYIQHFMFELTTANVLFYCGVQGYPAHTPQDNQHLNTIVSGQTQLKWR